MKSQRGGAVADIFIAIGVIVVFAAVAGVACGACASGASPLHGRSAMTTTKIAAAPMRYRDDRRECGRNGSRCDDGHYQDSHEGGCNNFCPKFDKSPVDHSFNFDPTICLPGSTCNVGDKGRQPAPKDGQDNEGGAE